MSSERTLEQFSVKVSDDVLADLRRRLANTRWPDQMAGTGWDYGTDLGYLQELCEYWRTSFDWRGAEARLNAWPQYLTEIDGQRIHFIHARSRHANAMPLVMTHGWPGSVSEFLKVLGPLTEPEVFGGSAEDAFHVVAPSMPGYGFSGPTTKPGWNIKKVAETNAELMAKLGYSRYGAQGGDWGGIATALIGRVDPEHLAGIHMNMLVAGPPAGVENPMALVEPVEAGWLGEMGAFMAEGTGYQQIQGTRPQTLAYGLNDSPAGLAGWIVEKFRAWSDCAGDVESRFTKDELLTNIMIYWVTGTINSSTRLYCESMRAGLFGAAQGRVEVPTGAAIFPKEIYKSPRKWAEAAFNITSWDVFNSGGHFAAMEEPEALVKSIRGFFAPLR
jgi:pimeloyl-ACP methyl ester carboxylesterase